MRIALRSDSVSAIYKVVTTTEITLEPPTSIVVSIEGLSVQCKIQGKTDDNTSTYIHLSITQRKKRLTLKFTP